MRIRNTIIVLVLAALVGGYAFIMAYYSKPMPAQTILNIKPEDIAKIELKYPDRDLVLERKKGADWMVTKPIGGDGDQTVVNNLARAIATAQVTRTVDEKPADLAPFGLATPMVTVTVTTFDGKTLPGIEVGKVTPVGFNAYIKLTDKPTVMLTSSAFPSGMNKTLDQVRSRDLMTFKVDDVTKITLAGDTGAAIEIVRDGSKWNISKPGEYKADPTQVRQMLTTLNDAKVADFITDAPASVSQYGLEKPHLTVTVYTDKGAKQQSILFGFKQSEQGKDGIYVRRGERTPVYTVHEWVLNAVDRSLFDLRDKTVMGFEPSAVHSVDVKVASGAFSLRRGDGGRWDLVHGSATTAADVPVVERFLDEVRDLKGVSIIADPMASPQPYGLDQPQIVITMNGKDGKSIGTMKLSKITVKQTMPMPGQSAGPRAEYYATSTAGKAVYSVSDFSFSQLNKPAELFKARPATPAPAQPTATPAAK